MKEKFKTIYICSSCGDTSPQWFGKCPSCGEWNTLCEDVVRDEKTENRSLRRGRSSAALSADTIAVQKLADVDTKEDNSRIVSGIEELDRVLGGGVVLGSLVLLGGEPGAGKSTMLLQLCSAISKELNVLYVTGEESVRQIKLRSSRLGLPEDNILVAAENNMDDILVLIEQQKPGFVVIDSIQTMVSPALSSAAGSVSQVKECTSCLLNCAKSLEIPIFIVGHVNKDGAIAGPKVMEHIVDTVLYFEGDRTLPYRILRAAKNRFGSTNEIGMFDMTGDGLIPISNPSEMLLEGRPVGISGNCVGCIIEGTRPIMAEIQSIVSQSAFGTPRRATNGFDASRVNVLLAVLEKRAGFFLGNLDVYINVVGGLALNETACDLPLCLAVVSQILDKPVPDDTLAIGEIGLGGEIRSVANLDSRLREAQRIGFTKAIVPQHNIRLLDASHYQTLKIVGATYIKDAIAAF